MQEIYIIQSADEMGNNPGAPTHILKAFTDRENAMEYIAECGYQVEQYNKKLPKEVEDDDQNKENWDEWCHNHPFCFEDGSIGTSFELVTIELE
jgi:hypothetical protein